LLYYEDLMLLTLFQQSYIPLSSLDHTVTSSPSVLVADVELVALSLGRLIQPHGVPEFLRQWLVGLPADQLPQGLGPRADLAVLAVQ